MKKEEATHFRNEVDSWIKSFKRDIDLMDNELQEYHDEIKNHNEELQFNFENVCRLESKVDRLEQTMERMMQILEVQGSNSNISNMQPLKDKPL